MDRIDQLADRAAQGLPLFSESRQVRRAEILAQQFWTARNGFRHATQIVRVIGGRQVVENRAPPYLNPVRQKECEEKRQYRALHKRKLGKKWLRHQCELKAASRARTGQN
jgi:hypothetical protein